jgi:hypothetical protein
LHAGALRYRGDRFERQLAGVVERVAGDLLQPLAQRRKALDDRFLELVEAFGEGGRLGHVALTSWWA